MQLQDIDLRSRGVGHLIHEWKANPADANVRTVWGINDLVLQSLGLMDDSFKLYDYFREHGQFPNADARFNYFIAIVEQIAKNAHETDDLISIVESAGVSLVDAQRFRKSLQRLDEIIGEDRFATDIACSSGALDDWD